MTTTRKPAFRGAHLMRALVTLAALLLPRPATTQTLGRMTGDTGVDQSVEVSPASPRKSIETYLDLARQGRFDEASRFLDLPDSLAGDGARLARQLKAVLDRHVWLDLEELSAAAVGDTADGLSPRLEQIAEISRPDGTRDPVRIGRSGNADTSLWRFTRTTVQRIPSWYASLDTRWIAEHLPAPLLRRGPLDLLWWQWTAIPLILLLARSLGSIASRLVGWLLGRVAVRTATEWDDVLLDRLRSPLTAAFTVVSTWLLLPWLGLNIAAAVAVRQFLRGTFLLIVFWASWRLIDVAGRVIGASAWARTTASSRALIPLGTRAAKSVIVALGAVAAFSLLGYPVGSLIAGLGLGGLAFALAAQKTVENLFGAFSIGLDQPFREGDFVKVEDFVGTVESIGLRSSRFRTLDRTLITIPNGRLADMRLESFAVRDRLRLATTIGVVYETTATQMNQVLDGLEAVLRSHPKIWPDAVVVRFREFAASSLDIEIMAWFETADWGEFQLIRQQVLLQFMRVVEEAGTSIAFPTRTVHLASLPTAMAAAGQLRRP